MTSTPGEIRRRRAATFGAAVGFAAGAWAWFIFEHELGLGAPWWLYLTATLCLGGMIGGAIENHSHRELSRRALEEHQARREQERN